MFDNIKRTFLVSRLIDEYRQKDEDIHVYSRYCDMLLAMKHEKMPLVLIKEASSNFKELDDRGRLYNTYDNRVFEILQHINHSTRNKHNSVFYLFEMASLGISVKMIDFFEKKVPELFDDFLENAKEDNFSTEAYTMYLKSIVESGVLEEDDEMLKGKKLQILHSIALSEAEIKENKDSNSKISEENKNNITIKLDGRTYEVKRRDKDVWSSKSLDCDFRYYTNPTVIKMMEDEKLNLVDLGNLIYNRFNGYNLVINFLDSIGERVNDSEIADFRKRINFPNMFDAYKDLKMFNSTDEVYNRRVDLLFKIFEDRYFVESEHLKFIMDKNRLEELEQRVGSDNEVDIDIEEELVLGKIYSNIKDKDKIKKVPFGMRVPDYHRERVENTLKVKEMYADELLLLKNKLDGQNLFILFEEVEGENEEIVVRRNSNLKTMKDIDLALHLAKTIKDPVKINKTILNLDTQRLTNNEVERIKMLDINYLTANDTIENVCTETYNVVGILEENNKIYEVAAYTFEKMVESTQASMEVDGYDSVECLVEIINHPEEKDITKQSIMLDGMKGMLLKIESDIESQSEVLEA